MKRMMQKGILFAVVCFLLLNLVPDVFVTKAAAIEYDDKEIYYGMGRIGNVKYDPESLFSNFGVSGSRFKDLIVKDEDWDHTIELVNDFDAVVRGAFYQKATQEKNSRGFYDPLFPGFSFTITSGYYSYVTVEDIYFYRSDHNESRIFLFIDVASDPTLKALAEGGTAQVELGFQLMNAAREGGDVRFRAFILPDASDLPDDKDLWKNDKEAAKFFDKYTPNPSTPDNPDNPEQTNTEKNFQIIHKRTDNGANLGSNEHPRISSGKCDITTESVIVIEIWAGDGDHDSGVEGLFIEFSDEERPIYTGYGDPDTWFSSNGTKRYNDNEAVKQWELFLKKGEYVEYNTFFSEPVRPFNPGALGDLVLFTNPAGTGLPGAGENQYMKRINEGTNVAKEKEVTASKGENAEEAVDGNSGSGNGWEIERYQFPATLTVDLGDEYTINSFKLIPEIWQKSPESFTLEYSNDDENFTNIGTYTYQSFDWDTHTQEITPVTARYFRLSISDEHGQSGVCISEFELLGESSLSFIEEITYKYTTQENHHSGNLPVEPEINGWDAGSLFSMFYDAEFIDAAGNVVELPNIWVDAFDYKYEHISSDVPYDVYRVIVDAVPPKYSRVGNGIQPEILTGVTLCKDNWIEFTVQLTEPVMAKEGWDHSGLFLRFNNGMKAYYQSGINTDTLKFGTSVNGKVDVSLLKVIALSHDEKSGFTDKNVLQDYAGNMLIEAANVKGPTPYSSFIDWAKLSIDNTRPSIDFSYDPAGANNTTYKKSGKITIDANDPPITTPLLDPDEPGVVRPSKGIYRPSNMTGSGAPAVGLVYYLWSKDPDDPFAAKSGDNFAAVKRYSLTALQPGDGLYPGEFPDLDLMVANNKTNMLAPPPEALTSENSGIWYLHAWTGDMTWDSARELKQYAKGQAQLDAYMNAHPDVTKSEADEYFRSQILPTLGNYDQWPLTDFKKNDSNWTYARAEIGLDNKKPTITFGGVSGNNTDVVTLSVSLNDGHSGLDLSKLKYQWAKKGQEPEEIDWMSLTLSGGSATLSTLNEVIEDGEYELYVKGVDKAGNENIQKLDTVIKVNSEVSVVVSFTPDGGGEYTQGHDITFYIEGITPEKVEYAFSTGISRPLDSQYTDITLSEAVYGSGRNYTVPANTEISGSFYLHIKVKESGKDRFYYYSEAYQFDNIPSEITFSINSVMYPKASHEVTVSLSESGMVKKYRWVRDGEDTPQEEDPGWIDLPLDGRVTVDNTDLEPGETLDYRLYVWVIDGAGNSIMVNTGIFRMSKPVIPGDDIPTETADSDLLYIQRNVLTNEYYAIIRMNLEAQDKEGYYYSVSPDGGASWTKWRPYTNFAEVKVPSGEVEDIHIQVKYRAPNGVIGETDTLDTGTLSQAEPLYALATHSTLQPVGLGQTLTLEISAQPGIKVAPAAANPETPQRIEGTNSFRVSQNGFYSFDLTDLTDDTRKDTLFIVVDNFDTTPPLGTIEYLTTIRTNGNVRVRLQTSEPVRVTNNNGSPYHVFTENGAFTFEFADAAGNTGSATAEVENIDKEPPQVEIVYSYAYGENGSKTFKTIKDAAGNVILRAGVTAEVQKKEPEDKDFIMLRGNRNVTLRENGPVEFIVADLWGNTQVLREEVEGIVSLPPQVDSINYTFVDDDGKSVTPIDIDGQPYAKGKVKAEITGKISDAENMVFSGIVPVQENSAYKNEISDSQGNFTYAKVYGANGNTRLAVSDLLGNIAYVPVTVTGLDNTPPEIKLNQQIVGVTQNKEDFDFRIDLGGFTDSDNVSNESNIEVTVSGLDLSKLGRQRVTYTAKDQVGNTATASQDVYVVSADGMLIFGNNILISGLTGEMVLFERNTVEFSVSRYNVMPVKGEKKINEWGTYDLLYYPGLYREGQMKYIAEKITSEELYSRNFRVKFPKVGWYTIIIRNQEREREYGSFFIGKADN